MRAYPRLLPQPAIESRTAISYAIGVGASAMETEQSLGTKCAGCVGSDRRFELTIWGLVLIGAALRLAINVCPVPSLTLDEAAVANRLSEPWSAHAFLYGRLVHRPVLYVLLCKLLAGFYNVELVLRLSSILPSIAELVLFVQLAKRLLKSRLSVLFCVFAIALNPYLINYARMFKPYALEHAVCVLLMLLFVRWRQDGHGRSAFLTACLVSAFLAYSTIFLCVPLFLWVAAVSVRGRRYRTAALYLGLLGTITLLMAFASWLAHQHVGAAIGPEAHRGLPPTRGPAALVVWFARQSSSLLTWLTRLPVPLERTPATKRIHSVFIGLLYGAGLVALCRRRRFAVLLMLTGPLCLAALAGWFGQWPFRLYRTNLFMISLFVLVAGCGVDVLARLRRAWPRRIVYAVLAAYMLVHLPWTPSQYRTNAWYLGGFTEIKDAIGCLYEKLRATPGAGHVVYVNNGGHHAWIYYTQYHKTFFAPYRDFFERHVTVCFQTDREPETVARETRAALAEHGDVWFLLHHLFGRSYHAFGVVLNEPGVEWDGTFLTGAQVFHVRRERTDAQRDQSAPPRP